MANHQLLTNDEMSLADSLAVKSGVPSLELMASAGQAVVDEILHRFGKRPVTVICGPGNNGGDGFVIAQLLKNAGWPVRLGLLGNLPDLQGDAAHFADFWDGSMEHISNDLLDGDPLIVDALFGAGLSRPLTGTALQIVQEINNRSLTVVAVDLPSGINGTTGQVMGDAIQATLSITFFRAKQGHYLMPGRDYSGQLIIKNIGINKSVLKTIQPLTALNTPEQWDFDYPAPDNNAHKYSRGFAVIIGGANLSGAAILAARSCRRIGCGMVSIAVPNGSLNRYQNASPGDIVHSFSTATDLQDLITDKRVSTILSGPGADAGETTKQFVLSALETRKPVVLDAGALSSFHQSPEVLFKSIASDVLMTPHSGEFQRIFGQRVGSKVELARQAAKMSGATVLLKGPDTVIAHPDGRVLINNNASPWLATAGSGDVLAGICAGLMAQGLTAFNAAAMGCWIHGQAATRFGPGLIAEDLAEQIPFILNSKIFTKRSLATTYKL